MRGAHFHGHHPSSGRARPRSVSASDGVGTLDAARKAKKAKEVTEDTEQKPVEPSPPPEKPKEAEKPGAFLTSARGGTD